MASNTEICNLALAHLGTGKAIADLESEQSEEATVCRRFYNLARETTLRDVEWPFATKIAAMQLISTNPNSEWDYSYQYPSDCLSVRRILSGIRNDTRQSKVEYRIAKGTSSKIVFTDEALAYMEYTERVEDEGLYPPDFVMAFSLRLASYVASRLSKGDPFKKFDSLMAMYKMEISQAKANAFNEEQMAEEPDSEFIRARE